MGSVRQIDAAETIFTDTAEFKARLNWSSDAPFYFHLEERQKRSQERNK